MPDNYARAYLAVTNALPVTVIQNCNYNEGLT